MTERRQQLYEGKAKVVYATEQPDTVWIEYKDDATAFDGKKRGTIGGKGVCNNQISAILFRMLEGQGIPTHFIDAPDERTTIAKHVRIIPIEVVVRNVAAGSLAKRLGWEEGRVLPQTIIEHYYKNDELGDPLINHYHVQVLGLATPDAVERIDQLALKVNESLRRFLKDRKLDLIDFKLEFGIDSQGNVLLADEISPDTCRFWDTETKEKLDKDRFRRDLGGVEDAYQEVLRRVRA